VLVLGVCLGSAFLAAATTWWASARWLRTYPERRRVARSPLAVLAIVAVAGGGLFLITLEMVRAHRVLVSFDGTVVRFGATHATSASTDILRALTDLGSSEVLVPLAVVIGVVEARRLHDWAPVAFLAVILGGQYALVSLVKAGVDRSRPDVLRLTGFSGSSFPSGHATASAAAFAAFALLIGRGRDSPAKSLLAGAAVGLAVLVAATRVMLGVHWLTDVLAGLCLGWAWFALVSIAFSGRPRAGDVHDEAAQPARGKVSPSEPER